MLKALPPTRHPITVDPFTSGACAYTVACADKMERSYLDKSLKLRPSGLRSVMRLPHSLTTQQTILPNTHCIYHSVMCFVGAGTSNYKVNPRNRGSRWRAKGDILPDMPFVRSTSWVNRTFYRNSLIFRFYL